MMDVNQYLGVFLEESKEHLQTLNRCLLELEHDPGDLHVLDEIFRSAHTIKGMSATMGYTAIAELTHDMENVLDLLRKGSIKAGPEIIDTLFQCVDSLEHLVEDVSADTQGSVDVKPLVYKLTLLAKGESLGIISGTIGPKSAPVKDASVGLLELNGTESRIVDAAISQGLKAIEIEVRLREGTLLKSVRAYMVMKALDEFCDVIKTLPVVEELEKDNFANSFSVLLVTESPSEKVRDVVLSIAEVEEVLVHACQISSTQTQEKTEADLELSLTTQALPGPAGKSDGVVPGADKKQKGRQLLRVDTEKLDSLLNLVGELVINKTRLQQIGQSNQLPDLSEAIEQMDRVTTDLQAVVMKLRMVPVGQVFNRFPRMVRDLSHELGKEINLVIQGEDTELDRTVIDEIGDPLVHLLRNSIDHGVEKPSVRSAAGKNPVGEIRLIARHEGNNVALLVEDDGRGIDPEVIKAKALEKGLVTKVEVERMDTAEIMRLVFMAGFSTAEKVTDVSGRGVGMDAVRTKIESLGGIVEMESNKQQGTRVRIRLPLTLAIIQALLIQISDETYAIPLGCIDSTINLLPSDIRTVQQREVILLRGQVIPILRLADMLGLQTEQASLGDQELYVVIVQTGDNKIGILVDALVGQQEIVIKSLGRLLSGIRQIAGATILGDGQVVLILDVNSLAQ